MNVAGHAVQKPSSKKLLGIIVNKNLTWADHLYGNQEHKGLIAKLSQRAGIIKRLSKIMKPERLEIIANDLFFSLICYGLPVFGTDSGFSRYMEGQER